MRRQGHYRMKLKEIEDKQKIELKEKQHIIDARFMGLLKTYSLVDVWGSVSEHRFMTGVFDLFETMYLWQRLAAIDGAGKISSSFDSRMMWLWSSYKSKIIQVAHCTGLEGFPR